MKREELKDWMWLEFESGYIGAIVDKSILTNHDTTNGVYQSASLYDINNDMTHVWLGKIIRVYAVIKTIDFKYATNKKDGKWNKKEVLWEREEKDLINLEDTLKWFENSIDENHSGECLDCKYNKIAIKLIKEEIARK